MKFQKKFSSMSKKWVEVEKLYRQPCLSHLRKATVFFSESRFRWQNGCGPCGRDRSCLRRCPAGYRSFYRIFAVYCYFNVQIMLALRKCQSNQLSLVCQKEDETERKKCIRVCRTNCLCVTRFMKKSYTGWSIWSRTTFC